MQCVSREVRLPGIELATLTGPHDVGGIDDHSGPVKALPKCVAHEGAQRSVVTADAGVDVPDQLLPLGMGMHRCRMPEGLCLYSSSLIRTKDLARLAMHRA